MITKFKYNPLELAFCGYSGSGKTTLIEKLITRLSNSYDIGYVKHDAHKFVYDKEGKDTARMYQAGAKAVTINDKTHFGQIQSGQPDPVETLCLFSQFDFVFAEGYKKSSLPKILVEGDGNSDSILKTHTQTPLENIVAIVGPSPERPSNCPSELPYFQRDNIPSIEEFILNRFSCLNKLRPLKGLLLAGGKSSRMGSDKAQLKYHGRSQVEHCFDLLSGLGLQTYVSARKDQEFGNLPVIEDRMEGFGPAGGILSAQLFDSNSAWLVVAIDLPLLNRETLKNLIDNRNPYKFATTYLNPENQLPEPLCTIYEPKIKSRLFSSLGVGRNCPRKILIQSNVANLQLTSKNALDNANHPSEFKEIISQLQSGEISL